MQWQDIREKNKDQDRYYEHYDEPEGFWVTLDPKIVAFSHRLGFPFGTLIRFIFAVLMSNRYEPMPIGNNDSVTYRWSGWPSPVRYILWRIRNPWEDLKKFYLGFALAQDVEWQQVTEHFGFWWAKFKYIPFRLPFPYYKNKVGSWELMIGWKSRGVLSITIRRR